jgi:hypothetical protein
MIDFEYVNAITLSLIVDYDALLGNVAYKPYYVCHVRVVQDYTPTSTGEVKTDASKNTNTITQHNKD